MPRQFNYTNRHRILHEHVQIKILDDSSGKFFFDANVDLEPYGLSEHHSEARVFVEAYRGGTATWKRFDYGTVGGLAAPSDRSLQEFRVPEGIRFRVRITNVGDGRLVAEADGVRPIASNESQGFVQPLIQHMPADDIGDELWRIEFSDDLPLLKINDRVASGVEQFLVTPERRSVYACAVMREVLQRILYVEKFSGDEDDEDNWRVRWLRFAAHLAGRDAEFGAEVDEIDEWIDEAVEGFAIRTRTLSAFNAEIDG